MAIQSVAVRPASFPPWLVGTMHTYLLEMGFTSSTASPCVYSLGEGAFFSSPWGRHISLHGADSEQVLNVIEKRKDMVEKLDRGDATFLLGMGVHRTVNAGTSILSQETYSRTIPETYGMANAHPTKTPADQRPCRLMRKKKVVNRGHHVIQVGPEISLLS